MEATLELLIPDRKGVRERVLTAVKKAGGETRRCLIRGRLPGVREAVVDITYPDRRSLLSILGSLGVLTGVAVRGFDLRRKAVGRSH